MLKKRCNCIKYVTQLKTELAICLCVHRTEPSNICPEAFFSNCRQILQVSLVLSETFVASSQIDGVHPAVNP